MLITHRGSALITGMIFLLVLTVLAAAGMRMARFQLLMAGDEQYYVQARNAAEAAIEVQIATASFSMQTTEPSNHVTAQTPPNVLGESTIRYLNSGMAPDGGFSDEITSHRFQIDATGEAPAGTNARVTTTVRQSIYVIAPGSSN